MILHFAGGLPINPICTGGTTNCGCKVSERLELMRPLLDKFRRDFTVFDFGSGVEESSLGAEIAAEYSNSVVIAAEKDPTQVHP